MRTGRPPDRAGWRSTGSPVGAGAFPGASVSTQAWAPPPRRLGAGQISIPGPPVPSNVPGEPPAAAVAARRAELTRGDPTARVVCHFGTYGPSVTRILA